jgi:hypothetical protein
MVDLKLATLTVVDKADRLGRDEPMLWTMFIELSVATLNSHQFVVVTDPLKSKLKKAGKGDTVTIPASVGRYHRTSGRIFAVGVIAAAFDNDLRTQKQIKDGYAAGAKALNQAILDHFRTAGFADPTDAQEEAMGKKVSDAVRQAVIDAHKLGGLVAFVGGGKSLGSDKYFRKLYEDTISENVVLRFNAKKDRALYRVDGKLTFTR